MFLNFTFFQLSTDSFISLLQAFSGWFRKKYGITRCIQSSFDRNSQTPSLAIIINLSSGYKSKLRTSGSGLTPTDAATKSPRDLDIAKPGMFSFLSQTLYGPSGLPFSSKNFRPKFRYYYPNKAHICLHLPQFFSVPKGCLACDQH